VTGASSSGSSPLPFPTTYNFALPRPPLSAFGVQHSQAAASRTTDMPTFFEMKTNIDKGMPTRTPALHILVPAPHTQQKNRQGNCRFLFLDYIIFSEVYNLFF